jgi:hypothetical protein
MTQSTPLPQSRRFSGRKGVKTICQPFYSPNTATADLFLFQIGEVRAGGPPAFPGQPQEKVKEGGGGI